MSGEDGSLGDSAKQPIASKAKIGLKQFFYGIPRAGSSLLLDFVLTITIWFYYEYLWANPLVIGIATMLGKFGIALSGFFMGYLSDRFKKNPLGRRKPFILMGAPLLALSFIMLYLPHLFLSLNFPNDPTNILPKDFSLNNQGVFFMWVTIWVVGFNVAYGMLLTPYQSMLPEAFEEKNRLGAAIAENIGNFIASAFVLLFVFLLPELRAEWGDGPPGEDYTLLILGLALITLILYIIPLFVIPTSKLDADGMEEKMVQPKQLYYQMKRDIRRVLLNSNFVRFVFFIGIAEMGTTITFAVLTGYLDNVFPFSDDEFIILALIILIVAVTTTFFWSWFGKKKSIHKAISIAYVVLFFVVFSSLFIGHTTQGIFISGTIFLNMMLFSLVAEYLYQYVMLANLVDEDARRTGKSHSGAYHGVLNGVENIFQGLGSLVLGALLLLPNVTVEGNTFSSGYFWWGPVAAIFIFIALLIFRNTRVDLDEIIKLNKDLDVEDESLSVRKNFETVFSDITSLSPDVLIEPFEGKEGDYICEYCNKQFRTKGALERHEKRCSSKKYKFLIEGDQDSKKEDTKSKEKKTK